MKTKEDNIENNSDEELMHRFVESLDESALEIIVTRYRGPALRYASFILKDKFLSEDAVQETFIRIVKHRFSYDASKPFAGWFYTLLRHICIDIYRSEALRKQNIDILPTDQLPNVPVVASTNPLELIECLSGADREILILRFIHGMSFEKIAEYLSISIDAAKKRGSRALRRLRELLNVK